MGGRFTAGLPDIFFVHQLLGDNETWRLDSRGRHISRLQYFDTNMGELVVPVDFF